MSNKSDINQKKLAIVEETSTGFWFTSWNWISWIFSPVTWFIDWVIIAPIVWLATWLVAAPIVSLFFWINDKKAELPILPEPTPSSEKPLLWKNKVRPNLSALTIKEIQSLFDEEYVLPTPIPVAENYFGSNSKSSNAEPEESFSSSDGHVAVKEVRKILVEIDNRLVANEENKHFAADELKLNKMECYKQQQEMLKITLPIVYEICLERIYAVLTKEFKIEADSPIAASIKKELTEILTSLLQQKKTLSPGELSDTILLKTIWNNEEMKTQVAYKLLLAQLKIVGITLKEDELDSNHFDAICESYEKHTHKTKNQFQELLKDKIISTAATSTFVAATALFTVVYRKNLYLNELIAIESPVKKLQENLVARDSVDSMGSFKLAAGSDSDEDKKETHSFGTLSKAYQGSTDNVDSPVVEINQSLNLDSKGL